MTTAHTPGPWKTRKGFESGTIEIFQPDKSIKKPYQPPDLAVVIPNGNKKSNARLIAAAPDLLQELINIANADTCSWDDRSEFEAWAKSRARAAIAKATGGAA